MAELGKSLMDTVENDNEAFITQLSEHGITKHETYRYC